MPPRLARPGPVGRVLQPVHDRQPDDRHAHVRGARDRERDDRPDAGALHVDGRPAAELRHGQHHADRRPPTAGSTRSTRSRTTSSRPSSRSASDVGRRPARRAAGAGRSGENARTLVRFTLPTDAPQCQLESATLRLYAESTDASGATLDADAARPGPSRRARSPGSTSPARPARPRARRLARARRLRRVGRHRPRARDAARAASATAGRSATRTRTTPRAATRRSPAASCRRTRPSRRCPSSCCSTSRRTRRRPRRRRCPRASSRRRSHCGQVLTRAHARRQRPDRLPRRGPRHRRAEHRRRPERPHDRRPGLPAREHHRPGGGLPGRHPHQRPRQRHRPQRHRAGVRLRRAADRRDHAHRRRGPDRARATRCRASSSSTPTTAATATRSATTRINDNELGVSLVAGAAEQRHRGQHDPRQPRRGAPHPALERPPDRGQRDQSASRSTRTLDSDGGVLLDDSHRNVFRDNTLRDTGDAGLRRSASGSNENRVEGNTMYRNGDAGVFIQDSERNEVIGNIAHQESDGGVVLSNAQRHRRHATTTCASTRTASRRPTRTTS